MNDDERRQFLLSESHRKLDDQIRREQRRPMPDSVAISDLKRKKLLIKEQLEGLTKT